METRELLQVDHFAWSVLNAMPLPIFIVDHDANVFGFNEAALQMLAAEPKEILRRRAGEILHCVHSRDVAEGCGRSPFCRDCLVRSAVDAAFKERTVVRRKGRVELVKEGKDRPREIHLLATAVPVNHPDGGEFVLLTLQDISELVELKRILPICAHCKKIRDDEQYWHQVEEYLNAHMDLEFSHGLCPDCARTLYPYLFQESKSPT